MSAITNFTLYNSSLVESSTYTFETSELQIVLENDIRTYANITEAQHDAFRGAESQGSALPALGTNYTQVAKPQGESGPQ